MNKRKLVILDANSLLNRAYYALPPMTTSNGQPTGAVYGFTTMLLKILEEMKPDYIAAAFDKKAPTFRHKEYEDYKAGRKKMPDDLAQQFPPVKELLQAFNVGIFEIEGYEADDIIGTIAKKFESPELDVYIYTGDRDALQLVSKYTRVIITKKGITETDLYDIQQIKDKYGLTPEGIIDLKGLMGDASDNIPGVPGVGEKTAIKLLLEYKTLENVFENLDKVSGKKLKENLEKHRDDAFLSKKLATIDRNVPIDFKLDDIKVEDYDAAMVKELFKLMEFKSLGDRIKLEEKKEIKEIGLPEIKEYLGDSSVFDKITKEKTFNFVFTYSGNEVNGMMVDKNLYVTREKISDFKEIFESDEIKKNTFGLKRVYSYLKKNNINLAAVDFDFEIAAYLLNPSENDYGITTILEKFTELNLPPVNEENSKNITVMFLESMENIKALMLEKMHQYEMLELFNNIEMPLCEVLAKMEIQGFKIDKNTLNEIGFELSEEIDKLTAEIYDIAAEEFNINSPKQLGVILFEKLQLPIIKKTKTGYSTSAEVLEELLGKHEIIEKILSYRQLTKLKSTYIDGLIAAVESDGKIHSNFNQTVTATGRISSTEPNLQNIPIKMEYGRTIRKAFIPSKKDNLILSADYSQIELRVLAHLSKDENLIDAFINNQDIHTRTASEVFGISMDEVTKLQRSNAKAVNFGIIYGLSDFGLSKDIKVSVKEAKKYIENYFERYKGVKKYLDDTIREAREKNYVKTLMHRIRFIPEINSTNKNVRMFGERLAMNTPIQGSAADIIKIAMVNVDKRLKENNLKSKLILQVHDELILEVEKEEADDVVNLVRTEMEKAVSLAVPLIVDINLGENWYETK
ncbi:DNA polymerase I [Fervidicella metallireducens AeB]|uniref:DNA polymerase I n=1 Tax=Fervidicella metallireducens AeB TaxID=1403537 RepID=A0A017RX00_9CLOT|nr:DNA polymerase I [Fervidicella metallireducens]EYE89212.1 DNA polymerase I [Fervidicella metallireducens AeB]